MTRRDINGKVTHRRTAEFTITQYVYERWKKCGSYLKWCVDLICPQVVPSLSLGSTAK